MAEPKSEAMERNFCAIASAFSAECSQGAGVWSVLFIVCVVLCCVLGVVEGKAVWRDYRKRSSP